jgi:acetoin utilization deacetylase AcuC-like enzyme
MRVYYADVFVLPLPDGHRFPMRKYALLYERVAATELVPAENLLVAPPADDEDLLRVHDSEYVQRVISGQLSEREQRRIGFPWSPTLVQRSRQSAGATVGACRSALQDGVSVSLAGGTHHAYRDHGQGFCVFNDAMVGARALQAEGLARQVLIIDCDVHQGNGTAAMAQGDASVFTFSIHGARNFPFRKEHSDLDIGLEDGTGDESYLAKLAWGLSRLPLLESDLAIYLAGADPFAGDTLGRLALTKDGLARRDRMVFDTCRHAGLPVAVVMSGGYARNLDDIVDIHFQTVCLAAEAYAQWQLERSRPQTMVEPA